ncbi:unnamed protein product, partial [Rhizoctonia solani]
MEVVGDGVGMGLHELQNVDSQGSEILEDSLFFFDTSAMTAWPTQISQYESLASTSTLGVSLQDFLIDAEPPYDPDAQYVDSGAKQCFNCMGTTHIVSDCPHKRDPQHIALARADYGSRGGNTTRTMRLHEAEEAFNRRMEFARTFEPGYVQGELLRESLGLKQVYNGGNEDLPWYHTMCDWGYPPGWVSDKDPRSKIMERINSTSKYESNEVFPSLAIFDAEESESPALPLSPSIDNIGDNLSTIPSTIHENSSYSLPGSGTLSLEPPPPPPEDPPPPDLPPPPPSDLPPASPPPPGSLPFPPQR